MLHKLISHSPDLKKLWDEGYEIEIKDGHLLVRSILYVNSQKEIKRGIFVSALTLVGDEYTASPPDHTIYFSGEFPCDKDGNLLKGIINSSETKTLAEVEVHHYCSAKPLRGKYENYYEKITTYVNIVSSHAESIDNSVSSKTFRVIESTDPDIPFHYFDTNSSRAEIDTISTKLKNLKIAIIGLGGTGSYVLDFVAKTPVREIHLFDQDVLLSHNAFRAPGATSLETLRAQPKKVEYLHGIYAQMHKYVIPHGYHISESTLGELAGLSFVFICIDEGEVKKLILQKLMELGISFADVGIGVNAVGGLLTGSVRVTTATSEKNDHVEKHISFSNKRDDEYDKNVQIAELNALNAALAVIKWRDNTQKHRPV